MIGSVGIDNNGLSGIEERFEKGLHGTDGERRIVKDALGSPSARSRPKRAAAGQDLQPDARRRASRSAPRRCWPRSGQTYRPKGATAIVMDPRNGEILAMANWPRVNANDVGGARACARQNRAVASTYEPGSTFKAFTVAGALAGRPDHARHAVRRCRRRSRSPTA